TEKHSTEKEERNGLRRQIEKKRGGSRVHYRDKLEREKGIDKGGLAARSIYEQGGACAPVGF
ncbi:hypothetical protein ACJX0J_030644, partial [Zea mays]